MASTAATLSDGSLSGDDSGTGSDTVMKPAPAPDSALELEDLGTSSDASVSSLGEPHALKDSAVITPEVLESVSAEASLEDIMCTQSRTGVIYATSRARAWGFKGVGDSDWGNLGQGAPETGSIPDQPARHISVSCDEQTNEYAGVNGRQDLRTAVADYCG